MNRNISVAVIGVYACLLGTVAEASTWRIRVFNVDDKVEVFINSTGTASLTCNYGQTCETDLTGAMVAGTNHIVLQVTNGAIGGYTYGYVLTKDSTIFSQEVCGMQGRVGCANNDGTQGIVRKILFKVTK
jgi:hypothetical protein